MSVSNVAKPHSLITALTNFAVPIVEMHKIHGRIDISQLVHSTQGDLFLTALGEFMASMLMSQALPSAEETQPFDEVHRQEVTLSDAIFCKEDEKKEDCDFSYFDQLPYSFSGGLENPLEDEYPQRRPSLLAQAMNKTRYFMFNKMPVRLLTFDSNGSNIRLIGRSEIWQNVSKRMVEDYDGQAMKSEISRILSSKVWGDTKNKAIEARNDAIRNFCAKYEQYAILSHTWIQDAPWEVVYSDWIKQSFAADSPGHKKLLNFCRVAAKEYNVTLAWMDSICINKENSAELDESIRSMYYWYQSATVCITYLAATLVPDQMHADPWFTRGWTLQEMLSPKLNCFYLADWKQLSLGVDFWEVSPVSEQIFRATSIQLHEMRMQMRFVSISRRMGWAARRSVTREEDAAYSLMGIFGVSMPTAYGEGAEYAFFRLVKEILATNNASLLDIVNWGHGPGVNDNSSGLCTSQLIPSRPQQYLYSASEPFKWGSTRVPAALTQKGLHVSALLMPGIIGKRPPRATFPSFTPRGNFFARTSEVHFVTSFAYSASYDILPESLFNFSEPDVQDYGTIFAVLNHTETADEIVLLTDICFAVALSGFHQLSALPHDGDAVKLQGTAFPITFRLQQVQPSPSAGPEIHIKKMELEKHGMFLRTLYM